MPVASAEAPILAILLPSSSAPIRRSRMLNRLETTPASRLPCFHSRSMLAREAPVSAVSLAAKKAETSRQAMTIEKVNQSILVLAFARQLPFEKIANQCGFDIWRDHGAAYGLEQDESQLAALDLLVLRHQRQQRVGAGQAFLRKAGDVLQPRRQADRGKMMLDARSSAVRNHPKLGGKLRCQHHAHGNALAMEQAVGKPGRGFQRMAKGVAEIEQRALAGFALVARDDRGLGAAGGGDGMLARGATGKDVGVVGFEPAKEGLVAEYAVFGDLGIA